MTKPEVMYDPLKMEVQPTLPVHGSAGVSLRENELTGVVHREVFDELPGDITTQADEARWFDFRAAYHRAQSLLDFTPFPLQLDFELNSTCQMKCGFCIHGQRVVAKRLLPWEVFTRVIDEGEHHGLCSIKMNYINEPLLNRDLPRFIEYAKAHGVLNVFFATNGLLLSEDFARELIRVRVNKVLISLDAVTAETFQLMRASKELDRIEKNIRNLIAIRNAAGVPYPRVRVNFLKTKRNAHEADAFIERWNGVADAIGFQEQVGLPGIENDFDVKHRGVAATFRCAFPFKLMVVDSAGDILPCCTFSGREMPMGNIATMTIAEAWNSAQMRRLKLLHRAGDFRSNPICNHCVNGGGGDTETGG